MIFLQKCLTNTQVKACLVTDKLLVKDLILTSDTDRLFNWLNLIKDMVDPQNPYSEAERAMPS